MGLNPLEVALSAISPDRGKVRTFDPKKVLVTFGPIVCGGFYSGTFITIEPESDAFRIVRGTGGDTERVKISTGNCFVSLSLLQTSPVNDLLSLAHLTDMVGNAGVFPLIIKDIDGTQLFMSMNAFIIRPADMGMGTEVGERKWRFYCPEALNYIGGDNVFS